MAPINEIIGPRVSVEPRGREPVGVSNDLVRIVPDEAADDANARVEPDGGGELVERADQRVAPLVVGQHEIATRQDRDAGQVLPADRVSRHAVAINDGQETVAGAVAPDDVGDPRLAPRDLTTVEGRLLDQGCQSMGAHSIDAALARGQRVVGTDGEIEEMGDGPFVGREARRRADEPNRDAVVGDTKGHSALTRGDVAKDAEEPDEVREIDLRLKGCAVPMPCFSSGADRPDVGPRRTVEIVEGIEEAWEGKRSEALTVVEARPVGAADHHIRVIGGVECPRAEIAERHLLAPALTIEAVERRDTERLHGDDRPRDATCERRDVGEMDVVGRAVAHGESGVLDGPGVTIEVRGCRPAEGVSDHPRVVVRDAVDLVADERELRRRR